MDTQQALQYEEIIAQQAQKLAELNGELKAVKKSNTRLRNELRAARREKGKLLKERKQQEDRQHYKNGKRGGKYNG